MKSLSFCTLLLVMTFVTACYNPFVSADKSILTGQPCAPPCYRGLVPGESTRKDVERFVRTLRPTEQKSVEIKEPIGANDITLFYWAGERRLDKNINRIQIGRDGRVSLIEIRPDFDLRLKAVVDKYDDPEYLKAVYSIGHYPSMYSIEVYYPHKGFAVVLNPSPRYFPKIRADMRVDDIHYFAPADLASYLNSRYGEEDAELTRRIVESEMRNIRPWTGYGVIDVTCKDGYMGTVIACPKGDE